MSYKKGPFGVDIPYPETKCEDVGKGRSRRRRHRRRHGGDEGKMMDMAMATSKPYDSSSESSGSESSFSSSGSEMSGPLTKAPGSCGKGRRRHKHGGATPTPRELVNEGFNFWYNYKPNDFTFQGKPLSDWSIVPGKVKEVVNKVHSLWQMIEDNSKNITNIKAVMKNKAPAVAQAIERMGFGRKHIGKRLNSKLWKMLHRKARRQGGDAFDDKLSSFGVKGVYDNNVKNKYPAVDKGLRPLYNAYAAMGDNADLIQSTVNAMPNAPQSAKDVFRVVTDAAKQGRQMGLGKKGKRMPSQRNMMVSKLMREEGLTLGEASKKVSAMLKGGAL